MLPKLIATRHDMHPSAASVLVAMLASSLERIVVISELPSHSQGQARTLMLALSSSIP